MMLSVEDEAGMVALGEQLAEACRAPTVFYLNGPLGAGKTTLVRGFMRGMGYDAAVKSPTYTLIEPYEAGPWRLFHLDLYRVHDAAEMEYLGVRDLQDGHAIILVEWPENGGDMLPPADVLITIAYADHGRDITLTDCSAVGKKLLMAVDRAAFKSN